MFGWSCFRLSELCVGGWSFLSLSELYVGFSCLSLLATVRGGTSFLFPTAKKKRSKENAYKRQPVGVSLAQPRPWPESSTCPLDQRTVENPPSCTRHCTLRPHGPRQLRGLHAISHSRIAQQGAPLSHPHHLFKLICLVSGVRCPVSGVWGLVSCVARCGREQENCVVCRAPLGLRPCGRSVRCGLKQDGCSTVR
jgi:hypothetical protein